MKLSNVSTLKLPGSQIIWDKFFGYNVSLISGFSCPWSIPSNMTHGGKIIHRCVLLPRARSQSPILIFSLEILRVQIFLVFIKKFREKVVKDYTSLDSFYWIFVVLSNRLPQDPKSTGHYAKGILHNSTCSWSSVKIIITILAVQRLQFEVVKPTVSYQCAVISQISFTMLGCFQGWQLRID